MKISFDVSDFYGCGLFRCISPGLALKDRGHEVFITRSFDAEAAWTCDVMVFQRQTSEAALRYAAEAREVGIKTVHEFDDNFHNIPPGNPSYVEYHTGTIHTRMMEKICRAVDALIVSTPQLAEYYSRFNPSVHVCYNAMDDVRFAPWAAKEEDLSGAFKREGQIRIGWAGSDTHREDFQLAMPALLRLMGEYPGLRVVLVGADMRRMFPFALRHRVEYAGMTKSPDDKVSYKQMLTDLATHRYYTLIVKNDFDIAIAPIQKIAFNSSKSYLKVQEWGFLGIPSVASNHTPYRQYAKEASEQVVLLADDEKEWYRRLKALIECQELRARLAKANLAYVKENHLMSKRVTQWERVFESLVKKDDVAA